MRMSLGFKPFASFTPVFEDYAAPGSEGSVYTTTITPPIGATKCTIECYGSGGSFGQSKGVVSIGGWGGWYAKLNEHSIASLGYSALYLSVGAQTAFPNDGADSFVKADNRSGSTLCLAKGGPYGADGPPSGNVGDLVYAGGQGSVTGSKAGGGCAGPSGNGGNGSGSTPGASGGGLAGAGDAQYGGGANGDSRGRRGIIRITWS